MSIKLNYRFKILLHCHLHRNHSGQKPILIFDCLSIVQLLSVDKSEVLCAGRHQMYTEVLDCLFSRLSAIAELVFFLDGLIIDSKFATWASRQNRKHKSSINILKMIYNEFPLNDIVLKHASYIYTNTLLNVIESSCQKFGRLNYAVKNECDQEIAQFAVCNPRVLAVFSRDTDFLIFPGPWRYFSTRDITLKTLQTIEFDRKVLRRHLNLNNYQMAIFATAAGNDIVRRDELDNFHKKFGFRSKKILLGIADYVTKNFSKLKDYSHVVEQLSKDLFGNIKSHNLERIKASLNSYAVHLKDDESSDQENPLNVYLHQNHLFTFNVLNNSPLNFSLVFFDMRQRDMPNSYFEICAGMFQRQAGIVLVHSSTPNASLIVYTKLSYHSEYSKITLPSIHPPFEVPLLEELYSDDPQFDDIRFALLKWTINWAKLKDYDLRAIPGNYMIDVLTITFMAQKGIIWPKEADILLWTIKNVENGNVPKEIKPPVILHSRAFRLAFLYVKLFANVARSIEVCGLKKLYWVSQFRVIKFYNN